MFDCGHKLWKTHILYSENAKVKILGDKSRSKWLDWTCINLSYILSFLYLFTVHCFILFTFYLFVFRIYFFYYATQTLFYSKINPMNFNETNSYNLTIFLNTTHPSFSCVWRHLSNKWHHTLTPIIRLITLKGRMMISYIFVLYEAFLKYTLMVKGLTYEKL